ncbi:MAG: 2-oxo acid dehydrogenase subunit E2 [Chitinispirillales bacterium]|jgi:pyruvate dehydrogenase E2 component (dihydrolipoamide acetyltransferase)|nr:2-oxo acid dehydrogenase subunit E2 [Chitinispirillales bacterium]
MAEKILMLALSPTMETGTITKWSKKEGEKISDGDLLCEVETDKAAMDYESQNSGFLLKILTPEGTRVKVGEPVAIIGDEGEDFSALLKAPSQKSAPSPDVKAQQHFAEPEKKQTPVTTQEKRVISSEPNQKKLPGGVRASPLARETAKKLGVDLSSVEGSGPEGRIIKEDVEQRAKAAAEFKNIYEETKETGVAGKEIPLTHIRKIIASRMSKSMASAPHFYLSVPVRMDSIISARNSLNSKREKRVSLNAFLIKFASEALARHPEINSSWQETSVMRFSSVNIGLAVALRDGLITPIIKNCETKGIIKIDEELTILIQKAKSGRLAPEEYSGATFTISNLGAWGVRQFTAIINPPASAILAVGEIFKEPVVNESGNIAVQSSMMLTLSSDHRVIDGAEAAQFVSDLRKIMEDPVSALF